MKILQSGLILTDMKASTLGVFTRERAMKLGGTKGLPGPIQSAPRAHSRPKGDVSLPIVVNSKASFSRTH